METYLTNISGINMYDIRRFGDYGDIENPIIEFLNLSSTRESFNVGNHSFSNDSSKVGDLLLIGTPSQLVLGFFYSG